MEKVRRRILSILLTLLILFSNSVVTFAYSQEVPEPFINVGTDNMSNQELEILIRILEIAIYKKVRRLSRSLKNIKLRYFLVRNTRNN